MRYYLWREGYGPRDASEEDAGSPEEAARNFAEFMAHGHNSESNHEITVLAKEGRELRIYKARVVTTVTVEIEELKT